MKSQNFIELKLLHIGLNYYLKEKEYLKMNLNQFMKLLKNYRLSSITS